MLLTAQHRAVWPSGARSCRTLHVAIVEVVAFAINPIWSVLTDPFLDDVSLAQVRTHLSRAREARYAARRSRDHLAQHDRPAWAGALT